MRSSELDPDDLERPDWNSLKANYDKHDVGEAYFRGRVEQMGLHVEPWGIDMRDHDDHLIFDNKMDLRLWEPLDGQEVPETWPEEDWCVMFNQPKRPDRVDAVASHPDLSVDDYGFEEVRWGLRGIIDVKTKANEDWLGVTNIRHLAHYAEWHNEYWGHNIPVAIYFTMVDMEEERVGERNILVPITSEWCWEDLVLHYDPDEDFSLSWPRRREIAESFPGAKETFTAPDGNDVVRFREDYYENFDWLVEEVLV